MKTSLKSKIEVIFAVALLLTLPSLASANFVVENQTDETIHVALTWTFIENDAHLYSYGWYTLRPGESHEFPTGTFKPTDRYWLSATSNGRDISTTSELDKAWGFVTQSQAYFASGTTFAMTNRHVATQMNLGNWVPILEHRSGLENHTEFRIQPKQSWNGFAVFFKSDGKKSYQYWD
jgi:hypothetical protein